MSASRAVLEVSKMTCGNCVKHVNKALGRVPGVTDPKVDLASGRVELTYDPAQADLDAIVRAIEDAGYPAKLVAG